MVVSVGGLASLLVASAVVMGGFGVAMMPGPPVDETASDPGPSSPESPSSFAGPVLMAAYFPYGRGIAEGFAYHPGEQGQGNTGDPNSKKLAAIFYGDKFVHTAEGLGPGTNPNALETRTFPSGSLIIPMDNKQADVVLSFGFMHALLRNGTFIYRIVEPPDVKLKTQGQPAGDFFRGGPVMVMPASQATFMQVHQSFPSVSYDTLQAEFTSNRVFIVGKPTRILLIKGSADWGETQFLLNDMKIPYAMTTTGSVNANPDQLFNHDLAVDDCGGWDTEYGGTLPAAVAAKMREFVQRGGEIIYTDRAQGELERAFPNYITVNQYGPTRVLDTTMVNVPEFPGQYYGNPTVKLYQLGSGAEMDLPIAPEVRVMAYHSPAGAAPTISLTAPSGGSLNAGAQTTIAWSASGGVAPLTIDLDYSVSGAGGPWVSIARNLANSGSQAWNVPYIPTTEGVVRATVKDSNWRTAAASSAVPFAISSPQLALDVGAAAADYTIAAGANTGVTVRVLDAFGVVMNATVNLSSSVGGSFSPASGTTDSMGYFATTFTAPATGTQLKGAIAAQASKANYVGAADSFDIVVDPTGQQALDVKVLLNPPVLHAGDTAYVQVKVTDGAAPVSGASLTATPSAGIVTPTTATTNATGESVFAFTLPGSARPMAISARVNATMGGYLDGTGEGWAVLNPMLDLKLAAAAQKGALNASEKTKIRMHVDTNSIEVPGASLALALTGPGSLSATSATTNSTGDAEVEYTAPSSIPVKDSATISIKAVKAGYTSTERPVWITLNAIADTSPPYIVSTTPASNATGVPVTTTIQVQWNESMDAGSAQSAFSTMPVANCQWSWPNPAVQVCTPGAPLQPQSIYDVTITTSARDAAGNPMRKPHQYSFTTGSGGGGNAPAVADTSPTDGSTSVNASSPVWVRFTQTMNRSATEAAISVTPAAPGASSWSAGDTTITLTPTQPMQFATKYVVRVGTGAKSAAGVPLPGQFTFSFTTETGGGGPKPPTVTTTSPKDKAVDVALNTNIAVTFNEEMDRPTTESSFTVSPAAPGKLVWSPDGTKVTLDPDADLAGSTDYAATMLKGAKSKAGVALGADLTFTFKTAAAPDKTPPVIVHAPVTKATEASEVRLWANVTDEAGVAGAQLHYRKSGDATFKLTTMSSAGGDAYRGTIQAFEVVPGVIEYYILATDTASNKATEPVAGESAPYKIEVSAKPKDDGGGETSTGGAILGMPAMLFAGLVVAVIAAVAVVALIAMMRRRKKKEEIRVQAQPQVDMWGAPVGWQGQQGGDQGSGEWQDDDQR